MSVDTKKQIKTCFGCMHFYITWDEHFPYGCKAMSFKSRIMPCGEVVKASGVECQMHQQKSR